MSNSMPALAKIKLKVGTMELEYEGDPSFLTGGIEALLETMGGLAPTASAEVSPVQSEHEAPATSADPQPSPSGKSMNFSTNTIAAHLDAKTGSELVICAMAQLEFVQGKPSSNRHEIIAEMKNASTYFKQTMVNNLTSSLNTLMKNKRINQAAKDVYALSANERQQLEGKIAEIG